METIEASAYFDPAVYQAERRAIWGREWVMFATESEFAAAAGSYVARDLAGYPLFVQRKADGSLAGFHNVCPHRAGVIVWPGEGTTGNLVCRYHGWAFNADGTLKSARDFGDDPDFCAADQRLEPIHVGVWHGLVFVNLSSDVRPLAEALAPFSAACAAFPLDGMTRSLRLVRTLQCNWKNYADNYLEGYHIPLLHPSLMDGIEFSTYRAYVPNESYCIHTANTTEGSPAGGAWLFRFPNLAMNIYAGGMNVERIEPIDATHCHVIYDYFLTEPNDDALAAMVKTGGELLDEDQAICEVVQRNLESGMYRAGHLSPKHEACLAWFQRRVVLSPLPPRPPKKARIIRGQSHEVDDTARGARRRHG